MSQRKDRKGIDSFLFRKGAVETHFLQRRLKFRLPTVYHIVDLMVHCSQECAPLFIDYVLWLLSRYERMQCK